MFFKRVGIILGTIAFGHSAVFAVNADSYDDFINAYHNNESQCEINLDCNIEAQSDLGVPSGKDIIIHGNNNVLDGNNCSGIVLNNNQSLKLDSITAQNFHCTKGAVIDNNSGCSADLIEGNFLNNSAEIDGGVLFNSSHINELKGLFSGNSAGTNGGAIYNNSESVIDNIIGTFTNNTAYMSTGGAIFNFGQIGNIYADFIQNRSETANGGAIVNFMNTEVIKGDFSGNYAGSTQFSFFNHPYFNLLKKNNIYLDAELYGGDGAIMNYGEIKKLSGSFTDNLTDGLGGAIRNSYGTINIISDEEEVYFSGNKDANGNNAIFNDSGTINLISGDYDIVFNDSISGATTYIEPVININGSGNVIFNNSVENNIINMQSGTLKFGQYNNFEGNILNSCTFNYYGGSIDLRDNTVRNTNLGNLNLFADMDLKLDGSFETLNTDTITADSFISNGHYINISNLIMHSVTEKKTFSCPIIGKTIDSKVKELLQKSIKYGGSDTVISPIYEYKVSYNDENGELTFIRAEKEGGDEGGEGSEGEGEGSQGEGGGSQGGEQTGGGTPIFSPPIYTAPVAAQIGGYLQQLNTYDEAFRRMSQYMLLPKQQRINMKYANKYANANENSILSYKKNLYSNKYGWISPYSIFENVPLKNGPKVSNTAYGTLGGIESEIMELPNNWDLIWGIYTGYNGSIQKFGNDEIIQNGGTLGILGMFYNNDFFGGITVNAGANACQGDNEFGRENFSMLLSGIALKTGYNIELGDGKYIIQPNYMMSYSFINTFPYNNSAGVHIDTKPLNAIQISPGIQFIGNFENGWQPYISASMVWNLIDKAEFKANDVSLPVLSIKPFVVYGAGVRKSWGERFSGYAQAFVTNGGRNGVGLNFGFRWQIGD